MADKKLFYQEETELADDMQDLVNDMAELKNYNLNETFLALADNILIYNIVREDGWYYG